MDYNRRQFLKATATLSAVTAISGITDMLNASPFVPPRGDIKKFGIQLYTLRDILPSDPKGILKQLASFGYKQIESYEHDKLGMFWGMGSRDFKKYMDDLGMKIVSSHCNYTENLERKADEAAAIGMKYLICPWVGPQKTLDAFKKFAETFNKCGEICKQRGLRFAYHNHDYTFKKVQGEFPQDVLMQNTESALVDFELDMYWVVTAEQNPVDWFKKYPGRFRLGHVKDRKGNKTATLGTGIINYPSILKEAEKAGMKYFLVEQEDYDGTTPIGAAKLDGEYMKKLKFKK